MYLVKANKKRADAWKVVVLGVNSNAGRNVRKMVKAHHVSKFLGGPDLDEGVVEEEDVVLQASVKVHRHLPDVVRNHNSAGIVPTVIFSDGGETGATNQEDEGQQIEDQAEVVNVGLSNDTYIA